MNAMATCAALLLDRACRIITDHESHRTARLFVRLGNVLCRDSRMTLAVLGVWVGGI